MKKNILLNSIILTVILLVFLKIDFRFQETVYCCGDDHDYYMHAETIGVDFDLDYKNQLLGNESKDTILITKLLLQVLLGLVF